MNIRSTQLTERILKGAEIWQSTVYTTFLQIPAEILNSNSKIVCLVLQCLSKMTYLNSMQLLDFNNEAMSKFTGIPAGTINRVLAELQTQATNANNWLIEKGFSERISIIKLKQFGSATIYNYQHTPPQITETFNAAITETSKTTESPQTTKTRRRQAVNLEVNKDIELKEKSLLNTGFEIEDLKQYYKYSLEHINRNAKYFIENYLNKGKPVKLALLSLTMQHDYGKVYLNSNEKAIEYLREIQKAIEIIDLELTDEIKEHIKKAYKFTPPADPAKFNNKAEIITHCNFKINALPDETKQRLYKTADAYARMLKYAKPFNGRTPESIKQSALIAALQIIHNAINFNSEIINSIAA